MALQQTYQFGKNLIPRCHVFLVTSLSYAFTNKKQVVPGHVLVSTIRPVKKFADLTSDEVTDLFLCVHHVGPVLQQAFSGTALTITLQDGKDAGQTVDHIHVHILPRRPGDFSVNNDIYNELAKHDQPEKEQQWRSYEEMAEEARKLEKLFSAQT